MVKNGCGQSGLSIVKLALSPEWTDEIIDFFACWHKFTQIRRSTKNGFGQSGHQTQN